MKVVHIVARDLKFINSYIGFMQETIPEVEHIFFTSLGDGTPIITKNSEIFYYPSFKQLMIRKELKEADKIIVSGVFWDEIQISFMNLLPSILKKTYFHFWGGDFYRYRNSCDKFIGVKERIKFFFLRTFRNLSFKRCAGLIFLIDGEYEEFQKITGVENKAFVAPLLGAGYEQIDYLDYKSQYNDDIIRIIVGNSATESNHHEEVFDIIKRQSDSLHNYLILCPLSYGKGEYREKVIAAGERCFGDNFVPITEFLNRDNYVQLLANCDIGIFNVDRQQAMGNINIMLKLGKTVYIRKDTSMWKAYEARGYILKSLDELIDEGICVLPEHDLSNNKDPELTYAFRKKGILQWKDILVERS